MTTPVHFWCVIPAAGSGARMQSETPKQYLLLHGKPVLAHTLERLLTHPRVAGVMIVHAELDMQWREVAASVEEHQKPILHCIGGTTRADSVRRGLEALSQRLEGKAMILVHDAARPFVTHESMDRLFVALDRGVPGAILAQSVYDSVKQVDGTNRVQKSLDRQTIWRAQTPQAFALGALRDALQSAMSDLDYNTQLTDESSAMERIGVMAEVIAGNADNIKITTPDDLRMAEWILQYQGGTPAVIGTKQSKEDAQR